MLKLKDQAKRAEWVYGQPMAPCPKCGSYNMKPQIPIAMETTGDETAPQLVGKWAQATKAGATPVQGPAYYACWDCFHKGPAVDCTGRTSEDCRADRALKRPACVDFHAAGFYDERAAGDQRPGLASRIRAAKSRSAVSRRLFSWPCAPSMGGRARGRASGAGALPVCQLSFGRPPDWHPAGGSIPPLEHTTMDRPITGVTASTKSNGRTSAR